MSTGQEPRRPGRPKLVDHLREVREQLFVLEHLRFIGGLRAAPKEGRYGIDPARSLRLRERADGVAAAIVAADRGGR